MKSRDNGIQFQAQWGILDYKDGAQIPVKRFVHDAVYNSHTVLGGKVRATRLMNDDPDMKEVQYKPMRWIAWAQWSHPAIMAEQDDYMFCERKSRQTHVHSLQEKSQGYIYLVWRREDFDDIQKHYSTF